MIITIETFKELTGIEGSEKDRQIAALIPLVEEDYLALRGKPFDRNEAGEIIYPAGSAMTAAEMISWKMRTLKGGVGISGEHIGDYSYTSTENLIMGYPREIVQKIKRYARFRR